MENNKELKRMLNEKKDVDAVNEEKNESIVQKTEIPVYGIVADCKNLYIRKQPNAKAEPIQTIEVGTTIQIDKTRSTSDFYKIYTASGIEGYCMRKFIKIQ